MFERICAGLALGTLTTPAIRLQGGFTHRMFRLKTDRGDYAVKLLNPEIMARPDAPDNYRTAEGFEALLEAAGLPILPARMIGGRKLQCVEGQHLYVFDYFPGRPLQGEEITPAHCGRIGTVLARIHAVPVPERPEAENVPGPTILWEDLAAGLLGSADTRAEGELLAAAAPQLARRTAAAMEAVRSLPAAMALCHNDMDPKNVLWQGQDFRIIDLECLGIADPRQELLDLAIAWSHGNETCFKAFVSAYCEAGGAGLTDAALVYDSRRNILDWLAYNARRALVEDPEERRIATGQIRASLEQLQEEAAVREHVLHWLTELA
ncbi:MAG: aminoglycoside phosphotransferase family protein [Clostridia bacterium]|nr:aminoglycoside phosphotransferase family protein [Clostridia bacterium]